MQKIIIKKEDSGQTAIKYLNRIFKDAPSGLLYKQIRKKNITLNDKKMTGSEKLVEGDFLSVFMSDETISKFKGVKERNTDEYNKAFENFGNPEIIYEDNHIMIINKPVGFLSQKSIPSDLSVNEWLIGYMLKNKETDSSKLSVFTPSVCNRLDRNTGGLLFFGKTLFGTNTLNKILKDRTVSKYYLTLVNGNVSKEALVEGYLHKNAKTNKVIISKEEIPGGELIKTEYKPVAYSEKNNVTELCVKLITGKTHQIRAHLSSVGYPIIGDVKYGDAKVNQFFKDKFNLKHQLLYAYKIVFPVLDDYPEISGKEIQIDISDVINKYM